MKTKKITPKVVANTIEQMLQTMAHKGRIQVSENKSPNEYTLNLLSNGICATFHFQNLDTKGDTK